MRPTRGADHRRRVGRPHRCRRTRDDPRRALAARRARRACGVPARPPPGAVYVSLEDELSDHTITGRGRHPLPSGRSVEASARRWGIRQGVPTVVYDDWNRAGSARAWWVLTAAGSPTCASWTAAWPRGGRPEAAWPPTPVTPPPGNATALHDDLYNGALPTLTAQQVSARLRRCSTRAHRNASAVTSSRSIRLPDTSPAPKNLPSGTCSTATARLWRRRRDCANYSPSAASKTAADWLRTAGPASPPAITVAALAAIGLPGSAVSRAHGRNGVPIPPAQLRAETISPVPRTKVCHPPSTAMRVKRWTRWSTDAFA